MFDSTYCYEGGRPSIQITTTEFEFEYEDVEYRASLIRGTTMWELYVDGEFTERVEVGDDPAEIVHRIVKPRWWTRRQKAVTKADMLEGPASYHRYVDEDLYRDG